MGSLGCVALLKAVSCRGSSMHNTPIYHDNVCNYIWQESNADTTKELRTAVQERHLNCWLQDLGNITWLI